MRTARQALMKAQLGNYDVRKASRMKIRIPQLKLGKGQRAGKPVLRSLSTHFSPFNMPGVPRRAPLLSEIFNAFQSSMLTGPDCATRLLISL